MEKQLKRKYLTRFFAGPLLTVAATKSADASVSEPADAYEVKGYITRFMEVDSYGDRMLPGAIDVSSASRAKMFFNHNSYAVPIGKWLAFEETKDGVTASGTLTKGVSQADDVALAIKAGTVDGLSVGGWAQGYENDTRGMDIEKFDIVEVSIVTFPAVEAARLKAAQTGEAQTRKTQAHALAERILNTLTK